MLPQVHAGSVPPSQPLPSFWLQHSQPVPLIQHPSKPPQPPACSQPPSPPVCKGIKHGGVTDKAGTCLLMINPISELHSQAPALPRSLAEGSQAVVSPYSSSPCAGSCQMLPSIHHPQPRRPPLHGAWHPTPSLHWVSAQIRGSTSQQESLYVITLLCSSQTQARSTAGSRVLQNAFDISFQTPGASAAVTEQSSSRSDISSLSHLMDSLQTGRQPRTGWRNGRGSGMIR